MSDKPASGAADGHDTQLVAVFEHRRLADTAHYALLSAGIPAEAIDIVDHQGENPDVAPASDAQPSLWSMIGRLFAPNEEAQALSHAVGQGRVMIVVHPADPAEREVAIEALEGCGPLDLDQHGADQPHHTAEPLDPTTPIAEPSRAHMVRIVEERMRVGWRDQPSEPSRVRRYVAAKPQDRQRVQLQEEAILQPGREPNTPE